MSILNPGASDRAELAPGDDASSPKSGRLASRLTNIPLSVGPLFLLCVLLLLAAVRGPSLFTVGGLGNGLGEAAPLVLATMALVPAALAGRGGIDLSVGPLMTFINVTIVAWLGSGSLSEPWIVIPWAILVGIGIAGLEGALVSILRLQPVVVTLGGYLVLSGLALSVLPTAGGRVPTWINGLGGDIGSVPVPALVLLGAAGLWLALRRTVFIRNVRLVGGDERTAFTGGIRVIGVRIGAYALGGAYAGAAGLMLSALLGSGDPTQGPQYTLPAVTALVLGGTSIAGARGGMVLAMVGGFDLWLIQYVLSTFNFGSYSGYATQLAYGIVLIAALVINGTSGNLIINFARRRRLRQ